MNENQHQDYEKKRAKSILPSGSMQIYVGDKEYSVSEDCIISFGDIVEILEPGFPYLCFVFYKENGRIDNIAEPYDKQLKPGEPVRVKKHMVFTLYRGPVQSNKRIND